MCLEIVIRLASVVQAQNMTLNMMLPIADHIHHKYEKGDNSRMFIKRRAVNRVQHHDVTSGQCTRKGIDSKQIVKEWHQVR
jgi:hypothetical protein